MFRDRRLVVSTRPERSATGLIALAKAERFACGYSGAAAFAESCLMTRAYTTMPQNSISGDAVPCIVTMRPPSAGRRKTGQQRNKNNPIIPHSRRGATSPRLHDRFRCGVTAAEWVGSPYGVGAVDPDNFLGRTSRLGAKLYWEVNPP